MLVLSHFKGHPMGGYGGALKQLSIGVAGQFLLIVLISFVATCLIYEIVKRMPVLRFFLGMTKQEL